MEFELLGNRIKINRENNSVTFLKHSAFIFILMAAVSLLLIAGYAFQNGAVPSQTKQQSSSELSSRLISPREKKSPSFISSEPETNSEETTDQKELVLVNGANKIPDNYKLDLTTAFGIQMDHITSAAYTDMWRAASEDGITLWISSGYRNDKKQQSLFSDEVEMYLKKGLAYKQAEAEAGKSVARPGYSEHATGLTLDLNGVKEDFDQTTTFKWLSQHAQDYGFILRYPEDKQNITKTKFEPWHYRYVGIENAKAIMSEGLCLEEYLSKG
ncbi:M15 family metallopeptidase [Caproicibacter sp. BJN0012]|uniref:M15 family metallopeptidase n=1 Tax=Caproicibacter sp. BJN0012 TaxID=3110227 RepID=UPI002E0DCF97